MLPARAAMPGCHCSLGTTAGLAKWLDVGQIFTPIAWKKQILLFLETQSFPNNMYFLQLQILAVERPPPTASAPAPSLTLADTAAAPLLSPHPRVPSKEPCRHLLPLTHGAAGL